MHRWLLPVLALFVLVGCSDTSPPAYSGGTVSKLIIIDKKVGTGPVAKPGMEVAVQYTGWLYDEDAKNKHGRMFGSTHKRNDTPFRFVLGAGQVIEGWDKGVVGMRVGGVRKLIIPPELAYGSRGAGGVIPPNASLVFRVKLVGVRTP